VIPYTVYKVVHYTGIFLLLTALVSTLSRVAARASAGAEGRDPWARRLMAAHGGALFLILLGGFGMLARLDATGGMGLPGWIWIKLGIWLALGAAVAGRRSPVLASRVLVAAPILAVLAGIVALTKPF